MIEIVTFTGVDDRTNVQDLVDTCAKYPQVEFGVLIGSSVGRIFPSMGLVRELRLLALSRTLRVSLHLCGRYARQVMAPWGADEDLLRLCYGFDRVQVNLHGDEWDPNRIPVSRAAILRFAEQVGTRVILQHTTGWDQVPVRHDNIEYLFDVSEGGGRESFNDWPAPFTDMPLIGYCGGLGPDNIERAIDFTRRSPEVGIWFDMEGRVRKNGWFDIDAVRRVCSQVFPYKPVKCLKLRSIHP